MSGVFLAAVAALLAGGPRRWMKGRHISRTAIRRLGYSRAVSVRQAACWGAIPFILLGLQWVYVALIGVVAVWALDDWLFPDDDDRKRRYEWARVRLRMPKPIKLRPIQKWAGAPA